MTRRASLPGADELFRVTSEEPPAPAPAPAPLASPAPLPFEAPSSEAKPRHEAKVTFYCTPDDLIRLERTRLALRSDHGLSVDRGRLVRAALDSMLEDFEARGTDSFLVRRLETGS